MYISLYILLIIPYLIIISLLITGWFRVPLSKKFGGSQLPFVSVLVPVKNEEGNLPRLISDLLQQDYSKERFEVIFIDDHSTDDTASVIQKFQEKDSRIRSISLGEKYGKKTALLEGIEHSKGDLILTTDGDCKMETGWINTMAVYYMQFPGHLLIGPVFFESGKGIFNQFQNLEFLSLIASGAGATGIGRPIMCNGANLGAHKSLFLKGKNIYQSPVASGDDIFLLLELKHQKVPSVFVKDNNAVVITKNSTGLKQFYAQRTRWTFKSRFYKDFDIIFVAIVVLFTNVSIVAGLLLTLLKPQLIFTILLIYLLKCFVDYILLYYVARFFKRSYLLKFFFVHQLFYIFYVSVVGFAGHFGVGKWKLRQS